MIYIKKKEEIEILKKNGLLIEEIAGEISKNIYPGIKAFELDKIACKKMEELEVIPAFLNYKGYPATICVSINKEVVHGLPLKEKEIKAGDIVSIDLGIKKFDYYADIAFTKAAGVINDNNKKLIDTTIKVLEIGISKAIINNRVGAISNCIEKFVIDKGFSVVKDYVGHGIGKNLHEEPQIPNYGDINDGPKLIPGMVLCIEPMINTGKSDVILKTDGWTVETKDGLPSSHFEDMILITENEPYILASGRKFGGY